MRLRRGTRALAGLLATALLLGFGGCVTPAVPVPPPEPENMSFTVDAALGVAQFSFGPEPAYGDAIVLVFNRSQGVGVIHTAESDGSVPLTAPFPAALGDEIIVTFELDSQSASTCVELQDGPSSSVFECVI